MRSQIIDREAVAVAVETSGRSLRELAALTAGLERTRPSRYAAVSRQTVSNLRHRRLDALDARKMNALVEVAAVPRSALRTSRSSSGKPSSGRRAAVTAAR
jgi:hypothetical protein